VWVQVDSGVEGLRLWRSGFESWMFVIDSLHHSLTSAFGSVPKILVVLGLHLLLHSPLLLPSRCFPCLLSSFSHLCSSPLCAPPSLSRQSLHICRSLLPLPLLPLLSFPPLSSPATEHSAPNGSVAVQAREASFILVLKIERLLCKGFKGFDLIRPPLDSLRLNP